MEGKLQIHLKRLISEDRIKEAFDILFNCFDQFMAQKNINDTIKEKYNSLVRLSSKSIRTERNAREGIIDYNRISQNRSRILIEFTDFIDDLPDYLVALLEYSYKIIYSENSNSKFSLQKMESILRGHYSKKSNVRIDEKILFQDQVQPIFNSDFVNNSENGVKTVVHPAPKDKKSGKQNVSKRKYAYFSIIALFGVTVIIAINHFGVFKNDDSISLHDKLDNKVENILSNKGLKETFVFLDSIKNNLNGLSEEEINNLYFNVYSQSTSQNRDVGYLPIGEYLESNEIFIMNSNIKNLSSSLVEKVNSIDASKMYYTSIRLPLYSRVDKKIKVNKGNISFFLQEDTSFRPISKPFKVIHDDELKKPIYWMCVEVSPDPNALFKEELPEEFIMHDTLLKYEYLEWPSLLLNVSKLPNYNYIDTIGLNKHDYILLGHSNYFFVSVASYRNLYHALMQRKHLLNLGYNNCKIVYYKKGFVVSLSNFYNIDEMNEFVENQEGLFSEFYVFKNFE